MTDHRAVSVDNLTLAIEGTNNAILQSVSFGVERGEVLAVVGESGSGKSTLGLALLGHTRPGLSIVGGRIDVLGNEVSSMSTVALAKVRGGIVSYVPQDASVSLDPACRIGSLLDELLRIHQPDLSKTQRRERSLATLCEVDLPSEREFLARYIHQLSGGQQQRLGIALAMVTEPSVVILDEPTTGLDALTQQSIVKTIGKACRNRNAAAVFITHDLEVVRSIADRALVLYSGRVAECGPVSELLGMPTHPYTRGLVQAAPTMNEALALKGVPGSAPQAADRPLGCAFHPRCSLAVDLCVDVRPDLREIKPGHSLACHIPQSGPLPSLAPLLAAPNRTDTGSLSAVGLEISYGSKRVVHGVDLTVRRGTCVGLIGASGSGKTTVSRALVGLVEPSGGSVLLDDRELASSVDDRGTEARRALQYVFQNPYSSLNPRRTILEILEQPARAFGLDYSRKVAAEWLDRVALGPRALDRRPDALSGGERQRVAIARALACNPQFLVCDEITAPLDVSVQATIVELIRSIIVDSGLGILFVTHDLGVMRSLADEVAIFQDGHCIEFGTTDQVFDDPQTPYAIDLVTAARGGAAATSSSR